MEQEVCQDDGKTISVPTPVGRVARPSTSGPQVLLSCGETYTLWTSLPVLFKNQKFLFAACCDPIWCGSAHIIRIAQRVRRTSVFIFPPGARLSDCTRLSEWVRC